MRARAFAVLFFGGLLLIIALSTGERLYLLLALVLACMLAFSLISALWALLTLSVQVRLPEESIPHGEQLFLTVRTRHRCPLPGAPLQLHLIAPEGTEAFRIPSPLFRERVTRVAIACPHVGYYEIGLRAVIVEDVFGLFAFTARRHAHMQPLLVLPRREYVAPLRFSPGDNESEIISRATEDASSPSGVRGYQQGDELKKVHWKLSLRKREILIKTYDQPMRPDALLLLDCTPPPEGAFQPWVQDRLCDLAASLCASLAEADAALRMPLTGTPPEEVTAVGGDALHQAFSALGRMNFTGTSSLERVLQLEARRMRRSGATVILTGRLSPQSTDLILRLRRMGPFVRVYVVVESQTQELQTLLQRLESNDVPCFIETVGETEAAEAS